MRGDPDPAARSPADDGLGSGSSPGVSPGSLSEADSEAADLADVVARASGGSERAWEDLVHRYARRVYAMANAKLRRPELAEEITQSVFVTLATKLRSDAYSEMGRFEPWLFRVTMNRVRDEIRRAKRQAVAHDPSSFAGMASAPAEPAGLDANASAGLRDAIATLNDADRAVIDLRHTGQMNFKDIAALLDEPLGTVLARHHRALKKLKAALEPTTDASDQTEPDEKGTRS